MPGVPGESYMTDIGNTRGRLGKKGARCVPSRLRKMCQERKPMDSAVGKAVLHTEARKNLGTWCFSPPVKNAHGGLSVYLNESEHSTARPIVQCVGANEARLRAPFGVSSFQGEGIKNDRMNLEFTAESTELVAFFKALDEAVQAVALQRCANWFKKELSKEEIASLYKPILTEKEGYTPTFRTKINVGKRPAKIHRAVDSGGSGKFEYAPGTLNDVTPDARFCPVIEISGMWFMSRMFGVSLATTHVIVYPSEMSATWPFVGIDYRPAESRGDDGEEDLEPEQEFSRAPGAPLR